MNIGGFAHTHGNYEGHKEKFMREYELVFLVADNVAEDKQAAVLDKIKKLITEAGGSVAKAENLGRRRLAYEIKKNEFATYHVVNFKVEGKELQEIEHDIRLIQEVLRHLIVLRSVEHVSILEEKLEAASEKEIAEAIGGERSVEQVEGETEASYDLMAKRDNQSEVLESKSPEGISQSEVLSPDLKEKSAAVVESGDGILEEKIEKSAKKVKKPQVKKSVEKVETEETVEGDKVVIPASSLVIPAKAGIQTGSRIKSGMTEKITTDTKEKVTEEVKSKTEKAESKKKPALENRPEQVSESKDHKAEDEAERLKKLDDKLADILGDDL